MLLKLATLGDIKKLAKNIKTAHDLALELWSTGHYYARLLVNQLMKNKQTVCLLETSEKRPSVIQRRLFWYYQARLRWAEQEVPKNSEALLDSLERDMADAKPYVQWAMNFCADQIGIHQSNFRTRCIRLGKSIGLDKDEHVARNCTPSYIPEFIKIDVAKRQ